MKWTDAIVAAFSPKRAYKRAAYRQAAELLARKYEGAARGRRTDSWYTPSSSANTETNAALSTLRNRSRDLIRNNPYAQRGVSLLESNVVGRGILPHILDDRLMAAWKEWAETPACDAEGKINFYDMQALAARAIVESGEVLIRKRVMQGGTLPLRLQLLESDFIAKDIDQALPVASGNQIIQGVEIDSFGRRIAYHLYEGHPGSTGIESARGYGKINRVPADQIIHAYKMQRPGQLRGVPWLAPVMIRLRDLDEYEDAQLVRQKIAACFSVFIKDSIESDNDFTDAAKELASKVEPGLIEMLPPGKDVTFASPPGVEGYNDYLRAHLHAIAVGLGISYEALTGDLSQVNFSSARMGWLEFQRNIENFRNHILNPQVNNVAFDWFTDAAIIAGITQQKPTRPRWTAPRRDMIDPAKEINAMKTAVRNGFVSWSDVVRENGYHPQDQAEQISQDYDLFDINGLTLDCDPRFYDDDGNRQEKGESIDD